MELGVNRSQLVSAGKTVEVQILLEGWRNEDRCGRATRLGGAMVLVVSIETVTRPVRVLSVALLTRLLETLVIGLRRVDCLRSSRTFETSFE